MSGISRRLTEEKFKALIGHYTRAVAADAIAREKKLSQADQSRLRRAKQDAQTLLDDAFAELLDRLDAAEHPERASVLAFDRSWSTPDALAPSVSSPERKET